MMNLMLTLLLTWVPGTGRTAPLTRSGEDQFDTRGPSGVPVLMYHHVSDPVNGYYGVSTNRFIRDLELLDRNGFFLIGPEDINDGLRRVPPDRRPLMLTFDDGWQDNFSFIASGDSFSIDPLCAVAILEEYCQENPDFGHGAVFFISWDKVPFGQEEYVSEKMNMLLDMGYSIGNHTDMHTDLTILPRSKWEDAVLRPLQKLHRGLGMRTSGIYTLSYPGGRLPRDTGAEDFLSDIEFMGRQAVSMGFLASGSVSSLGPLLSSPEGWFRIGRLDMSQYSVRELLQWTNIMSPRAREDLHDPLSRRIPPSDYHIRQF
ncbi:MAG: polysaccharide deacetylase family protein [Candidatus Aegiribacteria sp.]